MSTITKRALRWAGYAALVLLGWAAISLALPFVGEPGRPVAVVGEPRASIASVVAAGGELVEVRGNVVLSRSSRPGYARRLYTAGAVMVLEGRVAAGCVSLAKAGE